MMNGREKSDSAILAMKPANKRRGTGCGAGGAKGGDQGNTVPGAEPGKRATGTGTCTASCKAAEEGAVLHTAASCLDRPAQGIVPCAQRNAAPGVDGMTWRYFEAKLEDNLQRLHAQVQSGAYRALPVRRQYIPKPDGKQRPLGIAALEDKIVQRAVVEVLAAA